MILTLPPERQHTAVTTTPGVHTPLPLSLSLSPQSQTAPPAATTRSIVPPITSRHTLNATAEAYLDYTTGGSPSCWGVIILQTRNTTHFALRHCSQPFPSFWLSLCMRGCIYAWRCTCAYVRVCMASRSLSLSSLPYCCPSHLAGRTCAYIQTPRHVCLR